MALEKDVSADVCVVGAGFAGLTTAVRLAEEGKSVVVLEAGVALGNESVRTTAHVCSHLDDGFAELERLHGEAGARLAYESHAAAVDWIQGRGIACGFSRLNGWLYGPAETLARELEAARRAGFSTAELLQQGPLEGYPWGPCLKLPRQAELEPLPYLKGLAEQARRLGVKLHTGTRVVELEGGLPAFAWTENGPSARCQALVLATNAPINDRIAVSARQAAYRTYVVEAELPPGGLPKGLYWDSESPYHYVRAMGGKLVVGGEDHRTGQVDDGAERWGRLEAWTEARFPGVTRFTGRWSGQVQEPADGLAFIGRHPTDEDNVFIATGDSGNGVTHGTLAGILLTDLILGRESPWERLYSPSRLSLGSIGELAAEAVADLSGYAPYLTGGARGAVCPHFGGQVCWNSAEKTWDCPVHGSRFHRDGSIICGPAIEPLKVAKTRRSSRRASRRRTGKKKKPVT